MLSLPIILHMEGKSWRDSLEQAISELVAQNSALRDADPEAEDFTQQRPVEYLDQPPASPPVLLCARILFIDVGITRTPT